MEGMPTLLNKTKSFHAGIVIACGAVSCATICLCAFPLEIILTVVLAFFYVGIYPLVVLNIREAKQKTPSRTRFLERKRLNFYSSQGLVFGNPAFDADL
jgi:hypothetical protein